MLRLRAHRLSVVSCSCVGRDEAFSLNQLAAAVHSALGGSGPPPVRHLPKRHEVESAVAEHSKLRCFFRPPRALPLREGLAQMVAWLRSTEGVRRTIIAGVWAAPTKYFKR